MVLRLMPDWLPINGARKDNAGERRRLHEFDGPSEQPGSRRDDDLVRAHQISATLRNTPISVVAGLLNVILVTIVAWNEASRPVLIGWLACSTAILVTVSLSWKRNAKRVVKRASLSAERKSTAYAFAAALPWAVLLPLFYPGSSASLQTVVIAISAGMACGGALSLSRVSNSAQLFLGTVSIGAAGTFLYTGGLANIILAVATALYATAVCLMIRTLSDISARYVSSFIEIERKNQLINFLLKDFEENVSDWLWETNAAGEIVYHSKRMNTVTGLGDSAILGKPLAYWAANGGEDDAWRHWDVLVANRLPYKNTLLPTQVNGEHRFWQITARPLFDEDGNFQGYRGVAADVTLAQAADSMRLAKEEAEQANAAKSRFLAVMSHELRTPLNSIIGFAELIARELHGTAGKPEYVDYAKIILNSSHHLLSIINDVLDMARSEHNGDGLNETEFPLIDLVEGSLSFVTHAANTAKLELHSERVDDTLCLRGDARLLRQLLLNLLTNAIKFTPQGGEVSVSARRTADGSLCIAVKDTGVGVPADKLGQIFEPFVQVDDAMSRKVGGVGLGLSIAANIAKLHEGRLLFDSSENKGSTATLVLPADRVLESQEIELPMAVRA